MYILITGGFDPLHSGHIDFFESASKAGKVIVAANSDGYLQKKKKTFLMPRAERLAVIRPLVYVNDIILDNWDDSDNTSRAAIQLFYKRYKIHGTLAFANGGDRGSIGASAEESALCSDLGIIEMFNVGPAKSLSSSAFLRSAILRMEMNS
jgi:D-beta-D-heptose 7-phosphate kinase/D-beta-D-heptose 1-phosphate adenosyltransferase